MPERQSQTGKTVVNAALLRDFVDGKLDSEMEAKVAAFIDKHPKLQEQVEAMSGDGFLDRVRSVHGLGPRQSVADQPQSSLSISPEPSPVAVTPNDIPTELKNLTGYQIVKELGRGGMGVVYLAKNLAMGDRLEVLKVLNERLISVPEAKERFLREIKSVAILSHPSIVTAYNVVSLPNLLVFAMEYVPGIDLAKFIRQHNPLPIAVACSITQQIASGLEHGYEKKLVHRDIKPSNVMIYKSGKKLASKILDFGLAKATSEKVSDGLTQEGMLLGTLEYVAPEQMLNAAKSDIRADIYSLGCTLYHMLTGRPPFMGTPREIMMGHAQSEAPMVHTLRPDVPIELATVVAKMMAKEPQRRYASPVEIISELKPFLSKPGSIVQLASALESKGVSSDTNVVAQGELDTSVDGSRDDLKSILPSPSRPISNTLPRRATVNNRSSRRNRRIGIAAGVLFLLGMSVIYLSGILTVKTANGTLVIENLPNDADVTVDGSRVSVKWAEGKESAELSIKPGKHEVEVRQGNVVVAGRELTVASGQSERWSVSVAESNSTLNGAHSNAPTKPGLDLSIAFPLGATYEGNWTNHATQDARPDGSSRMTVNVASRTNERVVLECILHTWDHKWQFAGEVSQNRDGKLVFRSTDVVRLSSNIRHPNEGNTDLLVEFDETGFEFQGVATYRTGGISKFDGKRTDIENPMDDRLRVGNKWEGYLSAKTSWESEFSPHQGTTAEILSSSSEGFTIRTSTMHHRDGETFSWKYVVARDANGELAIDKATLIKKSKSFTDKLGDLEIISSRVELADNELLINITRSIVGGTIQQRYLLKIQDF